MNSQPVDIGQRNVTYLMPADVSDNNIFTTRTSEVKLVGCICNTCRVMTQCDSFDCEHSMFAPGCGDSWQSRVRTTSMASPTFNSVENRESIPIIVAAEVLILPVPGFRVAAVIAGAGAGDGSVAFIALVAIFVSRPPTAGRSEPPDISPRVRLIPAPPTPTGPLHTRSHFDDRKFGSIGSNYACDSNWSRNRCPPHISKERTRPSAPNDPQPLFRTVPLRRCSSCEGLTSSTCSPGVPVPYYRTQISTK